MKNNGKKIKNILFITLSNLGDIILTTPVFLKLVREYPEANVDVITGEPGLEIFKRHPSVSNVMFHRRHKRMAGRIKQVFELRHKKYDMVVDLKNSLIPYLIGAKYRFGLSVPGSGTNARHKKDEHLSKIKKFGFNVNEGIEFYIPVSDEERESICSLKQKETKQKSVVINPGAKSHLKRWDAEKYAALSDLIIKEIDAEVYIVGADNDLEVVKIFLDKAKEPVKNLCGKTSVGALAELMRKSDLVITNDSAPLHIASAVNIPTIAIFGPTDERKYGPLADRSVVLRPEAACRPCEAALCCKGITAGCIYDVEVSEVFRAAVELLKN